MSEQSDALIYAPTPPQPPGGVGSIVAMLHQDMVDRKNVCFVSPVAKGVDTELYRAFLNLFRLMRAIGRLKKGGRILFFSSAGNSFLEKLLWALLVMLRGRRPVVVMVAGDFPLFWDKCSPILRKISSWVVCNPRFVLGVQSDGWRKYYQSIFLSSCMKVVSATVAPEFFEHARSPGAGSRSLAMLYVGWIIPEKGIIDLLDAMAVLRESHPEARLRLVGPLFGKEDFWRKAAADRGVSALVEYVGPLSDRQSLIREFDAASIFVFPSHFEGFPVALLEAITRGLACVGTDVGGIPDILDQGRAGIIVSPRAPLELADALRLLLDDRDLVASLSDQASKRARNCYSHVACIESYKSLLELI